MVSTVFHFFVSSSTSILSNPLGMSLIGSAVGDIHPGYMIRQDKDGVIRLSKSEIKATNFQNFSLFGFEVPLYWPLFRQLVAFVFLEFVRWQSDVKTSTFRFDIQHSNFFGSVVLTSSSNLKKDSRTVYPSSVITLVGINNASAL